jgi:hypothetical protein
MILSCNIMNNLKFQKPILFLIGNKLSLLKVWSLLFFFCIASVGHAQGPLLLPDLPLTFECTNFDYDLTDFAGQMSSILPDPTDPSNKVICTTKPIGAEFFAGIEIGGNYGFENPIPFSVTETVITMRVWSPSAGIPILLQVENYTDPTIASNVMATTTTAMSWETLAFDFSNMSVSIPLDLTKTYNNIVVIFDYPNMGKGQVFYFDDIKMSGQSIQPAISCPSNPDPLEFLDIFNTEPVLINTPQDPSIRPDLFGMASATGICGSTTISYQDVISDPSTTLPTTWTVTRTWTANDEFNISSNTCEQVFTLVDVRPVPTLSQWSILILTLVLFIGGIIKLKETKISRHYNK